MRELWLHDLEALEEISQDDLTRTLFLRMAALSKEGRLGPFLHELAIDEELDQGTKNIVAEIALDQPFLFAFERYLRETETAH